MPGVVNNAFGTFLRARRDLTPPAVLDLPTGERRRVPGLRREELASLIGVSRDYYTRLEQGRERHPSAQVIGAIARALQLGTEETAHLFRLAQPAVPTAHVVDEVRSPMRRLLSHLRDVPACIVGPAMDILALNPLADAFYSPFASRRNLVEMVLLDPVAHSFFRDWDVIVEGTVNNLRAASSRYPSNLRIRQLVAELSCREPSFAALWSRQQIRSRSSEDKRYWHPQVGDLDLHFEACSIESAPGQQLFTYLAEPGSASAAALDRLAAGLSRL